MNIIALLKSERDKVARQLAGLNAALAAFTGTYARRGRGPQRRRKISAQGLANIRAAQKARWAKKSTSSANSSKGTPKRGISAAGLANIRKAQRARWAKIKAAKK
jgi:hypothetical protein